jgi:hypothetical protein
MMPTDSTSDALIPLERVQNVILLLRDQKVILDSDLAQLYGVAKKRLNEQVKRNKDRFPTDFMFQLTDIEFANLKSHFATSSWGGMRKLPYAFTEHGAIMAAAVLNSPQAIETSVWVVRAFVKLRQMLATHKDIARKLELLEKKYDHQFKVVFDAIKALMESPIEKKPPIGYLTEAASHKPKKSGLMTRSQRK